MFIQQSQIEAAGGQALYQFMLLTVPQDKLDPRIALFKASNQPWQDQGGDGFKAADIDLTAAEE